MKKKITTLLLSGAFILSSYNLISASEMLIHSNGNAEISPFTNYIILNTSISNYGAKWDQHDSYNAYRIHVKNTGMTH